MMLLPFRSIIQTGPIPKFDVKSLIATSPEAAMLGPFGDIPIGYYTGTADISIPMYTIKEGGAGDSDCFAISRLG
jgi:hypothetical protein